jgi:predicted ABC-type transport system involved in lysophospholipase L1 biosynthesis ATPase subunit
MDYPRTEYILRLLDGLQFNSGPDTWSIAPTKIEAGSWAALVPRGVEPSVDPSSSLARILATMAEPNRGTVEILGEDVYRLNQRELRNFRPRLGFVHGYGRLLSSRTIHDNVALPVSVHGGLNPEDEAALLRKVLRTFGLARVSRLFPHQVDGATRWRACLARALVLEPNWLVLEGLGDWEMDRGRGTGWTNIRRLQESRANFSTVVCLPRSNPGFEEWFQAQGGIVLSFERVADSAPRRSWN